ncbi:hypothetical protein ALC62_01176 [Cyphomyrmex costatus]|uniref:Uncharacterized protein n=1 Tax=Cyphomyrmex costatus TaxID=456900 RepID=A0A151IPE7_9HYME|nr:hypothetical protein ALC62_01176 [Cyphomyrmex costatus]
MVRSHRNGRDNKNDKPTLRGLMPFSSTSGKGLKMFDTLGRVLKGLKLVGRGPLSSALIEISLSRFYYLGMDAASVVQRGVTHQNNPGVTDKPPCVRRGNKRLYHTLGPVHEARPPIL